MPRKFCEAAFAYPLYMNKKNIFSNLVSHLEKRTQKRKTIERLEKRAQKQKTIERTENKQEFGSRPQASGERAKFLIRHASNDLYPVKDEEYNLIWNQVWKKKDRGNLRHK